MFEPPLVGGFFIATDNSLQEMFYNVPMAQDIIAIVAENLLSLRKSKGLTQGELAERFSYSDKSISKWERGESLPDIIALKDFADFYGVTLDYLVTKHDPENEKTSAKSPQNQFLRNRILTCLFAISTMASIFAALYAIFYISPIDGWPSYHFFFWMPSFLSMVLFVCSKRYGWKATQLAAIIATIWLLAMGIYLELGYDLGDNGWACWFVFPIAIIPTAIPVWSYIQHRLDDIDI